jgi:hypothetical protein
MAWRNAIAASPEAKAAQEAVIAAKKTLADAAGALAASKYPQAIAASTKDAAQQGRLDYTVALNRLELEGSNSPISAKIATDPAVLAAQKTLAEKHAALNAGTEEIIALRKAAAEADKKLRAAITAANESAGIPQMDAAAKTAAEKNQDAQKAQRDAAQKILNEKRTAALAAIAEAVAAQGRLTEIQGKLKASADAQRGADAKKAKEAEAAMKANPEMVAALEAVTKAQEAVKGVLAAEPFLSLTKAVATAKSELNTAVSKAQKSDAALIQYRKDLAQAQTDLQAAEKAEKAALNPTATGTSQAPEKPSKAGKSDKSAATPKTK